MFVDFGDAHGDYAHTVRADRVVRMSKSEDGQITFVHLDNGEVLASDDSMKTIAARVKSTLGEQP